MHRLAVDDSVARLIEQGKLGNGSEPVSAADPAGGWTLIVGILELILVLGLITGVIFLLIRFLAAKTHSGRLHPLLQTISVHPLASNRTIQLVAMEDRVYVLGVGEDITLIDIIVDEDTVDRIKQSAPAVSSTDLPAWVPKWLPIRRSQEQEIEEEVPAFRDELQSKLQLMKDQRQKIREWDTDER